MLHAQEWYTAGPWALVPLPPPPPPLLLLTYITLIRLYLYHIAPASDPSSSPLDIHPIL